MVRTFLDPAGGEWSAKIVSHGKTSKYLAKKVQRPVVQFTPKARSQPVRYAALPVSANSIGEMDDDSLRRLWGRAQAH